MSADNETPTPPMAEPQTPEDFIRRGWTLHVQGDYTHSEEDFREAMARDPQSVEAAYGLGMSLKIQGRDEEAIKAFEQAMELLEAGQMVEEPARATMLRTLSQSHIDMIRNGLPQEPAP